MRDFDPIPRPVKPKKSPIKAYKPKSVQGIASQNSPRYSIGKRFIAKMPVGRGGRGY